MCFLPSVVQHFEIVPSVLREVDCLVPLVYFFSISLPYFLSFMSVFLTRCCTIEGHCTEGDEGFGRQMMQQGGL